MACPRSAGLKKRKASWRRPAGRSKRTRPKGKWETLLTSNQARTSTDDVENINTNSTSPATFSFPANLTSGHDEFCILALAYRGGEDYSVPPVRI